MNRSTKKAFSLIEVVIALGIFSFAIVAILGLFSISLASSRESSDDTRSAAMVSQVVDALRAKPFEELQTSLTASNALFMFDQEGALLTGTGSPTYQCTVRTTSESSSSLLSLQLTITNPSGTTRVNYATIANYR